MLCILKKSHRSFLLLDGLHTVGNRIALGQFALAQRVACFTTLPRAIQKTTKALYPSENSTQLITRTHYWNLRVRTDLTRVKVKSTQIYSFCHNFNISVPQRA